MAKLNYYNTYWGSKGKYGALRAKLHPLVPDSGEVKDAASNPQLEKFRMASNCYYDLYNNHLANMALEFCKVFGFGARRTIVQERSLTQDIVDRTESKMDAIILAAAKEQGIALGKVVVRISVEMPEGADIEPALEDQVLEFDDVESANEAARQAFSTAAELEPDAGGETPDRPKLKTYPAKINGKVVRVTIPENEKRAEREGWERTRIGNTPPHDEEGE